MLRSPLTILAASCFLALSACQAKAQPTPPAGVKYESGVEYGKGGDVSLKLDIAYPEKSSGKLPCVVVIHGGGWRGGDRSQHVDGIFGLAKNGYVAATISYRFAPDHKFPAQIEDSKCAVRYLRANADKYNIDADRIGAIGFSAGAHLSMLLGVMGKEDGMEGKGGNADQSSQVQSVVSFFGPTNLAADDIPKQVVTMLDDLVGGTKEKRTELLKAASPVTYVSKDDGPMLLFQGTKDPLVPHTQATAMADAMSDKGVSGRVELIIGAGHSFAGLEMLHTIEQSAKFFEQTLKAKPAK